MDTPVLAIFLLLILPALAVFRPTVMFILILLVYTRRTSAPSTAHTIVLGVCIILYSIFQVYLAYEVYWEHLAFAKTLCL